MKLINPNNITGIDFSSLKQLQMLEISLDISYNLNQNENELKLLFKLLQETPKFNKLKI
jgi:hypothetical protein